MPEETPTTRLIIGATSAIASACTCLYAARGDRLVLLARNAENLSRMDADLKVKQPEAETVLRTCDFTDATRLHAILAEVFEQFGPIESALIAHGTLPDQQACTASWPETERALADNFTSAVSALHGTGTAMLEQGWGTIGVISSVAGERGRGSNFAYGAAKAGLTAYADGMRMALREQAVHVVTLKPGVVDTPMTAHLKKGPLTATPQAVAKRIVKAIDKRHGEVYIPWFWRIIMRVVREIPEPVFRRMKL